MTDVFSSYEQGLKALLEQLGQDHLRYTEALTLQSRLLENIAQARCYGDAETRRAERAQIVGSLNQLAIEIISVSFNELRGSAAEANGFPVLDQAVSDTLRKVIEMEKLVPIYQTSGGGQFVLIGLIKR